MNGTTQPASRGAIALIIAWIVLKVLLIVLLAHQDVAGFLYAGF
jgi:hypothetical protein